MKVQLIVLTLSVLHFFVINIPGTAAQRFNEDDDFTRFHESSSNACQYRRQRGVCRRRSQCRRPTRQRCRFGLDPIVCCLDPVVMTTTTTTTTSTTARPISTATLLNKPANIETMDITFPNCGRRSKNGSSNGNRNRVARNSRMSRQIGGGLLSLLGRGLGGGDLREKVIVGGVEAVEHSWPWMTAIYKSSGNSQKFLCGASLISRRYVLTASHCFDAEKGNIDPSKFTVVVGSHQTKDGTEYPVDKVFRHEEYKQRQYYNDVCLLRVSRQVTLGPKVHPVCLPSDALRSQIQIRENSVTVTGWGDTTFGGVNSKVLHEVEIPIVPLKECNASYWKIAKANFPKGINNLFICAGVKEGGKDACQGDSGGPMVTKLKDGSWVQLGVVSFGYGCAQPGYPGVYTRLSQFTQWLYDNTDLGK